MKSILPIVTLIIFCCFAWISLAEAKTKVVVTYPYIKSLVEQIAQDRVDITVLGKGATGFVLPVQTAQVLPDGASVVVSAAGITNPVKVRYAWAGNPEGCNLYNKAGLPASPFRTDQGE